MSMAHDLERRAIEKEELEVTIGQVESEKSALEIKVTDLEERLIKIEPKEVTP